MYGSLNTDGYHFWDESMPIAAVFLIDRGGRDPLNGTTTEILYHPTEAELKTACARFELPFDKINEIIGNTHDSHTLMIDVDGFLANP